MLEDDVEAYAWGNVAMTKGHKNTAEVRDTIKKFMTLTSEQITEGKKRSREIMESLPKE